MNIIGKLSHDKAMLLMERLQASPKFIRLKLNHHCQHPHAPAAISGMFQKWETVIIRRHSEGVAA